MDIDGVIKIKQEHDKKDFLREVAVYLTKEESTPTDILQATFSDVKMKEKEYLLISGCANIHYTCSVGYDRKEEYYEKERRYDREIQGYRYVEVKKTRTVTDWQAYTGENTTQESIIVGNADNQNGYRDPYEVGECFQTSKEESKEMIDYDMDLNTNARMEAEEQCLHSCFMAVKLPGDHQKDKNYSGKFDIDNMQGLILPEFETSYQYQGAQYQATGFAAGNAQVRANYPNISKDVSKEAKQSVKNFKYGAIGALILGVILNIFMNEIGSWFLIGYAAAIAFLVLYIKKGNETMKSIFKVRQEEKKKALIEFLRKNGMQSLSEQENISL